MAILTTHKQSTISIISFIRSTYGKFILKSEKVYEYSNITNNNAYGICLSPGGNVLVIAGSYGGSVWTYDPSQN